MKATLTEEKALETIRQMVSQAVGCTEPAAIAFATATAYHTIGGKVQSVTVTMDKNVFKNAMAVGVPGSGEKGPAIAAALSTVCGNPDKGLLILENVQPKDVKSAKKLLQKNAITLTLNEDVEGLFIFSEVTTSNGTATALITGTHDRIVRITKNDEAVFENHAESDASTHASYLEDLDDTELSIRDILAAIDAIPEDHLDFLDHCVQTNLAAAQLGLSKTCGMQLGAALNNLIKSGQLENTAINQIKVMTTAAVDARMGGLIVPICTASGSGNHGITYFLTIGLAYKHFTMSPDVPLSRALAFGLFILALIKKNTGLLTPACGCAIAAGAAASAAITLALGGTPEQILAALNLVTGNIAGLVCDGAKYGCALKIGTSTEVAIESALLALQDTTIPSSDGVVGNTLHETLQNLGTLHKEGMRHVDSTVLNILMHKSHE